MVARIITVSPTGFDGSIVEVEGDITSGLPLIQIVGLGNKAVDEAKDRVRIAISNSMLDFPKRRITINLAPAEIPKNGSLYDLPIALSILCASGQLKQHEVDGSIFAGELALDGSIKAVRGVINIVQAAKDAGIKRVFVPYQNINQAKLIKNVEIFGVKDLKQLYLHLKREVVLEPAPEPLPTSYNYHKEDLISLDDINGQEQAKRALIIAAAGHHNVLMSGTPGAGKTMLAKALANLLPGLSSDEIVNVTKIYNLAGKTDDGSIITARPFRSPHHSASPASIIGGGNNPKPGEISLAHTGVLFMDELPEFPRAIIESLRQPLEDKKVEISRANAHVVYPANFMLVATMNPCPCGYLGDPTRECSCSNSQIINYQKKLSGPLLDRMDLRIKVPKVSTKELGTTLPLSNFQHSSAQKDIIKAMTIQNNRYGSSRIYNSSLSNKDIKKFALLDHDAETILNKAVDKLNLSARGYFKTIKVSRTIADLDGDITITARHIGEALQYRQ